MFANSKMRSLRFVSIRFSKGPYLRRMNSDLPPSQPHPQPSGRRSRYTGPVENTYYATNYILLIVYRATNVDQLGFSRPNDNCRDWNNGILSI
jgi:hypothetical protein